MFENQVDGGTQIYFGNNGTHSNQVHFGSTGKTCDTDMMPRVGFKPSIIRQVCYKEFVGKHTMNSELLQMYPNGSELYQVYSGNSYGRPYFAVASLRNKTRYQFTHVYIYENFSSPIKPLDAVDIPCTKQFSTTHQRLSRGPICRIGMQFNNAKQLPRNSWTDQQEY